MFEPRATSRFRKDLKQHLGDLGLLLEITEVMRLVLRGEGLPSELKPHKLSGDYADCWECHILPDLLLVWLPDHRGGTITFIRLGRHADLFS